MVSDSHLWSCLSQGHTVDTNSAFLTRALRKLGVSVQRITVIPDVQEVIAKEVALLSSQHTHLITSGGIGPTHDDVTFESVAMAFQEEVYPHPELSRLVKEFFGAVDKGSPAMKMAMVPRSAKLNFGTDAQTGKPLRYPLVGDHWMCSFAYLPLLACVCPTQKHEWPWEKLHLNRNGRKKKSQLHYLSKSFSSRSNTKLDRFLLACSHCANLFLHLSGVCASAGTLVYVEKFAPCSFMTHLTIIKLYKVFFKLLYCRPHLCWSCSLPEKGS